MIRKNGKLERASWDEAMSLMVEKTKDIQKRLTNHGIGFYTSGQLFLEEYYALALVGKGGLNTLHMYVVVIEVSRISDDRRGNNPLDMLQGREHAPLYCHSCSFYAREFRL